MYIDEFLTYLEIEKNYSKHTIYAYKNDLISFKNFCEEESQVESIDDIHYNQIRTWIIYLSNQEVSNRSINRKISSLKGYFKFLQKIEILQFSPLAKHKSLKVSKRIQLPFSEKEIKDVLKDISINNDFESIRNKLIIELLYSTGIRRVELINLKESYIDFSDNQIKVIGKRNKERILPLLPSVKNTIKGYLLKRRDILYTDDVLLVTKKGKKLYESLVYSIINQYFSRVSTKHKKSPHILRHSFATHMLNQGADLNSVKELLGHSSLASTQVYTHNSLEELKKVYNNAHPRSKKNSNL